MMELKPWGSAPNPAFAAMGSGRLSKNRQPPRAEAYLTQLRQGIASLAFLTRSVLALRACAPRAASGCALDSICNAGFFVTYGYFPKIDTFFHRFWSAKMMRI